MNPLKSQKPRARRTQLALESLETRELMTGGAGNTLAILPGTISSAGGKSSVTFTIDPANFTLPRGTMTLGIDVVPEPGTSLVPQITAVDTSSGHAIPITHAIYNPRVPRTQVGSGNQTSAVLAQVGFSSLHPDKAGTYTVTVTGANNTSGSFLLGFYLPGDVTGDGTVNKTDLSETRATLGSQPGQTRYNFYADANRDGRINATDMAIVRKNMGVKTTISPIVAANLDPSSVNDLGSRVTGIQNVHFTGTATPGATVAYSEINHKTPDATAKVDSNGNYSLNVMLGNGSNTFQVTTHDSFGQSISGQIAPVTYVPPPTQKTTS